MRRRLNNSADFWTSFSAAAVSIPVSCVEGPVSQMAAIAKIRHRRNDPEANLWVNLLLPITNPNPNHKPNHSP